MNLIGLGALTLRADGKTFVLNPKDDLTPIELYRINLFIEQCKLNYMCDETQKMLVEEIYSQRISRHFEVR